MAEELYTDLMVADRWGRQSLVEPGFVYQRDKIGMGSAEAPPVLNRLHAFLSGEVCLKWISEVSGRRCDDFHGAAAYSSRETGYPNTTTDSSSPRATAAGL